MDKIWIIPICIFIICFYGVFWTLNLSRIDINFNMDNNTLEAVESIDWDTIKDSNQKIKCGNLSVPDEVWNSNVTYKITIDSNCSMELERK